MKPYSKSFAFTLIEMLFIVAIIGMVIALTLATFQQKTLNTKIDKTSLQLQQLIEAANTYYEAWGCWPKVQTCPQNAPDFNLYLPIGNEINPWGNAYTYKADPTNSQNFLISSGDLTNSQTAQRVASVLPNAAIDTTNPNQVIVSIGGGVGLSVLFQYFSPPQAFSNNGVISLSFECPKNWIGQAVAVPIGVETEDQSCYWWFGAPPYYITMAIGSNIISQLQTSIGCTKTPGPDEDTYNCSGPLTITSNIPQLPFCIPRANLDGGTATVREIGYCLPPSSTQQE